VSKETFDPIVLPLVGSNAQPLSIRAKALVFADPVSALLLDYIERLAPSEAPMLIGGETGTGKEVVARHIHQLSGRKGPFLAVNCGAISDQLAESELFGHEAGSFTGATGRREGWFEAANGGTLFLDEIGDLPLALQVKLLRVLQEREIVRIGSRKSIPVDIRLIVATNVDLDYAVTAGHFRRDLLYRINIAHVELPPLRERRGDILPLAEYFLRIYSERMDCKKPNLSPAAQELMTRYSWPGNIRELENVIHFALLVSETDTIEPQHIKIAGAKVMWSPTETPGEAVTASGKSAAYIHGDSPMDIIAQQLRTLFETATEGAHSDYFDQLESLIVNEAFRHKNHNQVHTAALLGISRNVMRTLLKRHNLLREHIYKDDPYDHNNQTAEPGKKDDFAKSSFAPPSTASIITGFDSH
jgi:DNA-binding NtrC family response regulator